MPKLNQGFPNLVSKNLRKLFGKILVRITKNHKISVLISLNMVCFFGREDSQGGGVSNSMIEDIGD